MNKTTTEQAKVIAEQAERIKELETDLASGLIARYDDDTTYRLSSVAGGASEHGSYGELTLMKEDEKTGEVFFRKYRPIEDWEKSELDIAKAALGDKT